MTDVRVLHHGAIGTIHDHGAYPDFEPLWLDPEHWRSAGARRHAGTGRGLVMMLDRKRETWVYRHYHRGGLVSRLVYDEYLWTGEERSRPFREWRLLDVMRAEALPVPRPVAARYVRIGPLYRADLVTVLLPDTRPLSAHIASASVREAVWPRIGSMLRRFHDIGIDHPDLTAHNLLVDGDDRTFLIDFDNALQREPGAWRAARIERLKRSLRKVALETGSQFDEKAWEALVDAYAERRA